MHTFIRIARCTAGVYGNWSTRNLELHDLRQVNKSGNGSNFEIQGHNIERADCRLCVQTFPKRFKQNGLDGLQLICAEKWFGANRNRRIVAHHGSSSQTLFWRTAKYASRRFQSASRKTGLTNYGGCILEKRLVTTTIGGQQLIMGLARHNVPTGARTCDFKLSNGQF